MQLGELLQGVATAVGSSRLAAQEREISALAYDSRKITPGALFVAIRGEHADGSLFVGDAVARGAVAIVSGHAWPSTGLPADIAWVQVAEPRQALAAIAANFYGRPAEALELVGITGTNGKTTTAFLLDAILRAAGIRTGLFGTIEYRVGDRT